jgi:hypothetical protein
VRELRPGKGPRRASEPDPAGSFSKGAAPGRHLRHGCWQRLPAGVRGALQREVRTSSSKGRKPASQAERAGIPSATSSAIASNVTSASSLPLRTTEGKSSWSAVNWQTSWQANTSMSMTSRIGRSRLSSSLYDDNGTDTLQEHSICWRQCGIVLKR